MKNKISTVYIQVDGVLADFIGHAMKACGDTERYPYSMDGSLATMLQGDGDALALAMGMPPEDLWMKVDHCSFWRTLPCYPVATEFVHQLNKLLPSTARIVLYMTIRFAPDLASARHDWSVKNFPGYAFCMSPSYGNIEQFIAGNERSVFVDHREDVLKKIEAAGGGKGVLVPRPWNKKSRQAAGAFHSVPYSLVLQDILDVVLTP